jgi:hypothetical protein
MGPEIEANVATNLSEYLKGLRDWLTVRHFCAGFHPASCLPDLAAPRVSRPSLPALRRERALVALGRSHARTRLRWGRARPSSTIQCAKAADHNLDRRLFQVNIHCLVDILNLINWVILRVNFNDKA